MLYIIYLDLVREFGPHAAEFMGSISSEIRTLNFLYNPAGQITDRTDTGGNFAFSGHTDQTSIYDQNALNPIIDIT